jgi:hypothetical protein
VINQFSQSDLLMAKFFVVDGSSYSVSETAVGHVGGHGYSAMGISRALGFRDASAKRSMTLADFQALAEREPLTKHTALTLSVSPLDYYLQHYWFGPDNSHRDSAGQKLSS